MLFDRKDPEVIASEIATSRMKSNRKLLTVGEQVVVGITISLNSKEIFRPVDSRGEKIKVERIWEETPGTTRIDLNWGSLGTSKVYAHDEGKLWHRVSNFN